MKYLLFVSLAALAVFSVAVVIGGASPAPDSSENQELRKKLTPLQYRVTKEEGYSKQAALFGKSPASEITPAPATELAVLGAGCFWCVEEIYEQVPGVVKVTSGYAGGDESNPTYHAVGSGRTGHAEVVEIEFDPSKISYGKLLEIFWKTHDPTDPRGVAPDFGSQYRSLILPNSPQQAEIAQASKARAQAALGKPIATEIKTLQKFFPAETYHQDYVKNHPDDPYVRNVSKPRFQRTNLPAILNEAAPPGE